jgi:hypothetical protein
MKQVFVNIADDIDGDSVRLWISDRRTPWDAESSDQSDLAAQQRGVFSKRISTSTCHFHGSRFSIIHSLSIC